MTPSELITLFDEWVASASDDQIRENCRTEGTVFFRYMMTRGVNPGALANLIRQATGHHPRMLWRDAEVETVRRALEAYFYSRQFCELVEKQEGRRLSPGEALMMSIPIWEV